MKARVAAKVIDSVYRHRRVRRITLLRACLRIQHRPGWKWYEKAHRRNIVRQMLRNLEKASP